MSNMFERPLYEFEPTPAQPQEGDLFHDYEVKGWTSSPGLFKVLGISAVANIVAVLVLAQTSLLTMKGCDSPLVGSVCQVLDTVYVGSLLFGTEREYVDVAYDRTELGEDDEITFIDASKITPPLTYPAGYFEVANPQEITPIIDEELGFVDPATQFTHIPGIPGNVPLSTPSTGESLFDTKPNIPKYNPDVIDDRTLPGNPNSGVYNPPLSGRRKGKVKHPPFATSTPREDESGFVIRDEDTTAVNHSPSPSVSPTPVATVEPTEPVDAFNTRPLKDTLIEALDLLGKNQLDLQAPIDIKAGAKFGKDGKFAKDSFRSSIEGDKQLGTVVTHAIAALNDSNFLSLLKGLSGKDINFLVKQDGATVTAAIRSEMDSDTRAQVIASLIRSYLSSEITKKTEKITALEKENDPSKAADLQSLRDDLALLKSIQPSNTGKDVIVGFSSPKPLVQQWLSTRLAEQRAAPKPTEATGGVPKPPADPAQK